MKNKKANIFRPLSDDDARRVLRNFDDGLTSQADEEALYAYFRTAASLPPDLAPLRGLMAWYEGGCKGEPAAPEAKASATLRRTVWRSLTAAAASAAILIFAGAGMLLREEQAELREFAEQYEGSYIIRNGVKITDPAEIRADILRAEARMDEARRRMAASDPNAALASALERVAGHNPRLYEAACNAIDNQSHLNHN